MLKKSDEKILFVKRIMHYSKGTWNGGNVITSEGNIYDFDFAKKYGGYKDVENDIFLIILNKIVQEKEPSRKCDKKDIQKAYQLAQKIGKNSEFVGLEHSIKDAGAVTLNVLIDEKLISLMSYDNLTGAVDCENIEQIYEIMHKNGIYQFNFFEKNNFKELRKNPKVIIYPFLQDVDKLDKIDDDKSETTIKSDDEDKKFDKDKLKIVIDIPKVKKDKPKAEAGKPKVEADKPKAEKVKPKIEVVTKEEKKETEKIKKRRTPRVKTKPIDDDD